LINLSLVQRVIHGQYSTLYREIDLILEWGAIWATLLLIFCNLKPVD
jgi:hypothetical protein